MFLKDMHIAFFSELVKSINICNALHSARQEQPSVLFFGLHLYLLSMALLLVRLKNISRIYLGANSQTLVLHKTHQVGFPQDSVRDGYACQFKR
jgi:hypothetical protein